MVKSTFPHKAQKRKGLEKARHRVVKENLQNPISGALTKTKDKTEKMFMVWLVPLLPLYTLVSLFVHMLSIMLRI